MTRPVLVAALVVAVVAVLLLGQARADDPFPRRKGLNMGTMPDDFQSDSARDVVIDGELRNSTWTAENPFPATNLVNYLDFYVSLDEVVGFNSTQLMGVTWDADDTVFAMQLFDDGVQLPVGGVVSVAAGIDGQRRLHAQIDCAVNNASSNGTLTLELATYHSLTMVFSYDCHDLLNFRPGFLVSLPDQPVIDDGHVISETVPVADTDTDSVDMIVTIDEHSQPNDQQAFDVTVDFDGVVVDVTADPSSGTATNKESKVTLSFACNADYRGEERDVTVTVTFIFPIVVGRPTYKDASFNLIKQCPKFGDSDGGWSGFGIFAFTVFILTLVFCVAGCLINRFHFRKSGADIIPGMPLFRKLAGKDDNVAAYSAQADLEHDAPRSSAAYGSFESNSNL